MTDQQAQAERVEVAADALLELAEIVYEAETLESVLNRVSEVTKRAIPGADEVSVTLIRGEEPFTAAYTGELALAADELQYERGYGPCVDAGRGGTVLRIDDMREETRWPEYAEKVSTRGVLSSLSVPLPIQDEYIGALNIYSAKARSFPDEHIPAAETIASYAAVAVRNAHAFTRAADLARNLTEAMASRAAIEQAKGIIMHEQRCSADQAFAILTHVSQQANIKIRDIATQMVSQAAER